MDKGLLIYKMESNKFVPDQQDKEMTEAYNYFVQALREKNPELSAEYEDDGNFVEEMASRPSYFHNRIYKTMIQTIPEVHETSDVNRIFVKNGIFNKETKQLEPFNQNEYRLAKIQTNYNPNATSPVIKMPDGVDWTFDSWLDELVDHNPDRLAQMWQIITAALNPGRVYNKCVIFYSRQGNNGKGTLGQVLKNIIGEGLYSSVNIKNFVVVTKENEEALYRTKVENNSVFEFFDEFLPRFKWDVLPTKFLYDLYVSWMTKDNANGKPVKKSAFVEYASDYLAETNEWDARLTQKDIIKVGARMDADEPLITEYQLVDFFDPDYKGNGRKLQRAFSRPKTTRGFVKRTTRAKR